MKEGAKVLSPLIRGHFSVDSISSSLGFGWLSAMIAFSGSPVAAMALSFLDAGVLSAKETFAMIAGSRLGASFIVLLVGFIYLLRGKKRETSLGVGLLSLLVTQITYVPVLIIGFSLLSKVPLAYIQASTQSSLDSPLELVIDPIIAFLNTFLPGWLFLPIGFACMIGSLWLFDRVLPNLHLQETNFGFVHRLLYRPLVTFLFGAVITTLTMSVSVSIGLLVPLSVRGYIRRENIIPYILGANITTFDDTLIAAIVLANPTAITVVLVQMLSVTLVSLAILLFGYPIYQRTLERLVSAISRHRSRLFVYLCFTFGIPIILLLLL